MSRLLLVFLVGQVLGCGGPLFYETTETKFTDPEVYDVQREFDLPGAVDLDTAQAAVVAVYARLMLPIEEFQTKDGPQFRLINGKKVNLSPENGLKYADCGERQEVKKRDKSNWAWEDADWETVSRSYLINTVAR